MYHRMYLQRCSMSSISEESETADDDDHPRQVNGDCEKHPINLHAENCLGDLNTFKKEIREAYEDLSSLEQQARIKTFSKTCNQEEDDLDELLEQLQKLEQRLDAEKISRHQTNFSKKISLPSTISAQFDELDQTLSTLTNTLNCVEIECVDSGNSSSSSATSDSTRTHHPGDHEEHLSDSGLSQSMDSISLPLISQQISNASSILSCDTLKNSVGDSQIRLALEKMHEANIRKLFVKIHNEDQSTKNILIDETMSIYHILILLFHKYHLKPTLNYAIIEDLPDLHLYRIFEDHQNLINHALIHWSRNTTNRICFQEHPNKYHIFQEPTKFFSTKKENTDQPILTDYISADAIGLPDDISSVLYIKDKTRKIWKKYTCILRQSGIYRIPKVSSSKHELICLVKFDVNMHLYYAKNWMETLRSPTEYGFALKHAHIQKKSTKYIHYLCANTNDEYQRWINGVRIILYGTQLHRNYQQMRQVVEDGRENLINLLPNQHHFNFITSTTSALYQSTSSISSPINQIISDPTDSYTSLMDIESSTSKYSCYSLDRLKTSKTPFTRSSSFHSSLRHSKSNKNEEKLLRAQSTSPPNSSPTKTNTPNLKQSKSSKEISSRSSAAQRSKSQKTCASSSSFIPFINQCIQSDKTPARPKPPKRPPPPIPVKASPSISNHIYDSLQDSPSLINEDIRTVMTSRLTAPRVTEL